jgi:TolB-like protein/predicted Ser/Thr protein kinase
MTIPAGTRHGRYEIRTKIGAGGMGEVYLAEDMTLHRQVAIKLLSDSAQSEQAKKRLLREAQAAAKLDHPNICAVYEVAEDDGRNFIVMQYVEGEALDHRLKRTPLDIAQSISIAGQVADALAEAHTRGIVHRDIKPANIMITARGQAKVMDFGLAKIGAATAGAKPDGEAPTQALLTTPGMILGTVPYMSPEQVKGEQVDARTDIFSFGAVLYEMLSGRQPFASQSAAETIASILNQEPPNLAPDVPAELQRIARKCLEKDRNLRYQNAGELRIDLQRLERDTKSTEAVGTARSETRTEADAPPAGDKAVYAFLELFALAFTFEGAAALLRGESLLRVVGAWVVAVIFFVLGIQWPKIRLRLSQRLRSRHGHTDKILPQRKRAFAFSPQMLIVPAVVVVLAFLAAAYFYYPRTSTVGASEIKSLAILPLKSLDAGENYLGLGIADAVIGRINQTGQVVVRPTSAVHRYLNEETDALTAARQLGVDAVLEGSVQRTTDRLRVRVNLLRVTDGKSLWTDSFDLPTADIFTIQDNVSQQVASRLRLQLDPSQQARLAKRYTQNPVAYEYYMKGMYRFDQRVGLSKAETGAMIDLFKQAIEADPNFALAHAQLGSTYLLLAVFKEPTEPKWAELANTEINQAQALDPQLAEIHIARYQLLHSIYGNFDAEAAVREVLAAQQLNPNIGHADLGYLYLHMGLEDLALAELHRALELDPTSAFAKGMTLTVYQMGGRYDEWFAARSKLEPNAPMVWYLLGKGRLDEAQKALDAVPSLDNRDNGHFPKRALLLALKGDFRSAEAQIPEILGRHPVKDPFYHHAVYDIACIYALQGKTSEAVKWLREMVATGFEGRVLERDGYLNRIRSSPEFIQFMTEQKARWARYQSEFGGGKLALTAAPQVDQHQFHHTLTRASGARYSVRPGLISNALYHASMLRTVSARY